MRKMKKMVALTAVWVLAFGCSAPAGKQAEAKAASDTKVAAATTPAKPAPAPAKPATPPPAPAKPATPPEPAKPAPAPAPAKPAEPVIPAFKAWDFTKLEPAKWEGVVFPGNSKQKSPNGAVFTMWKAGIGPEFPALNANASDFTTIRIEVDAFRTSDGKDNKPVVLKGVSATWAGEQDAKGKHPYVAARSASFQPNDEKNPTVWTAKISNVKTWDGKIARLGIGIDFTEPLKDRGKDRYLVAVKSIQFIK